MRARTRVTGIAGAAILILSLPLAAAWAADAEGCSGSVISFDAAGQPLGTAEAPGAGATQDDPLPIDLAGTIAWEGSTDTAITDGTWSVTAAGIPILSGQIDNASGETSKDGILDLSTIPSLASVALTGEMVVPVTGSMSGTGGSCSGEGFITGTGSPTSSPMFYTGIALAGVGLVMGIALVAGTKAAAVSTAASTTVGGSS